MPFHPYYTAKDGFGAGAVPDRARGPGLLPAQLSRPSGQLHPGQPALDAGAHRARMVFLAVLRDPARLHRRLHPAGQAVGRAGDVRARSCCSSSCPGSTSRRCARAATGRCSGCSSGSWSLDVAVLGYCGGTPAEEPYVMLSQVATDLLFRALPDHPADPLAGRADAAAAQLDHRKRAARRGRPKRAPADLGRRRRRRKHKGTRRHMVRILGFLVGLGFVGVAAWSLLWGVDRLCAASRPQQTVEHEFHEHPRDVAYSFDGPFGRFDRAAAPARLPGLSRKSARPATASAWSRSATCTSSATARPR